MSDNEDLLGDDLGDHSLADYNLGNEEEEQLLADDYESGASQNVPTSIAGYGGHIDMVPTEYSRLEIPYNNQPIQYHLQPDTECVVPNITVEIPNTMIPEHSTYAPYEPTVIYETELAVVPPAIPASPMESPQIVPSEMGLSIANGDMGGPRERFISERPPGAQRMPQVRDIPDSLDKVFVPRGVLGCRWRPYARYRHVNPFRRNNMHRGIFILRPQFPPPQIRPAQFRPEIRNEIRPEIRNDIRPDIRNEMHPEILNEIHLEVRHEIRPEVQHDIRPEIQHDIRPEIRHEIRPNLSPDMRPELRPDMRPELRPDLHPQMGPEIPRKRPNMPIRSPFGPLDTRFTPRGQYRLSMDEPRHFRPSYERPIFYQQRPMFNRSFGPPTREVFGIPQVTITQPLPGSQVVMREPEVRMLPVQLPPNLPPGGLAGKKVLINPHFKGTFQSPADRLPLPAYIPTRIQKSPPLSPTLENKFGPVKDIDEAAERFIAEQRNALARAASRKMPPRRSPQRYIENTTIQIENDLVQPPIRRHSEDDLLRRQEEFINANRAGLRRRMRSPTPPRRSASPPAAPPPPPAPAPAPPAAAHPPRRDPPRERRDPRPPPNDEENEYRRRMREQESLRERVLRAKEARRRRNALLQRHDRERERIGRDNQSKPVELKVEPEPTSTVDTKPDTTRKSPEKEHVKEVIEEAEVNSTCENLTPPRPDPPSPERALTPPLPPAKREFLDSDDDLDLILGDIDGILSDDEDSGRFKEKVAPKVDTPKPKPADLRAKLPPKPADNKRAPRQKIVFHEDKRDERKKGDKVPPKKTLVSSSTKTEELAHIDKKLKTKGKVDVATTKSRQRILYNEKEVEKEKLKDEPKPQFSNRRVILQRNTQPKEKCVFARIDAKSDPTKPNPGIFSRAVRTIGTDKNRIVIKKVEEPQIEYASDSDLDEEKLLEDVGNVAEVSNLPHGMTDTRLKTLAGSDVQSLMLDKEERSAKITFKSIQAAENFKKKFNNKMVAASRLTVALR